MRKPSLATIVASVSMLFSLGGAAAQARPPRHGEIDPCPMLAQAHPARGTQTLTLVNQANVDPQTLCRVERALIAQARQLHHYWHTPLIRFARGGWRVEYQHYDSTIPGIEGYHFPGPSALVTSYGSWPNWTTALSHEVVEMLADPSTRGSEICDPVADTTYTLDGVQVSDFVLPSWQTGTAGPWDLLGTLGAPYTTTTAGYIYGQGST